jgi:hypothetical protein
MRRFIDYLREEYKGAITTNCSDSRCKLNLKAIYKRLILIGENLRDLKGGTDRICDRFVFVWNGEPLPVIVELKSGLPDVSVAQEQLQNGANMFNVLVSEYERKEERKITLGNKPIFALIHGTMNKSTLYKLRKAKICFLNNSEPIYRGRCGESLIDLIKKAQN